MSEYGGRGRKGGRRKGTHGGRGRRGEGENMKRYPSVGPALPVFPLRKSESGEGWGRCAYVRQENVGEGMPTFGRSRPSCVGILDSGTF